MSNRHDLSEFAGFIGNARRLVVITGAGCSTNSGIGDYRDADGRWKRPHPVQHGDFVGSLYWRQRYWARSLVGYPEFRAAQPNAAHRVLARWEERGKVSGLITQNVDRLHQSAGHKNVIDLHGRLDEVVCLDCGARSSRDRWQTWLLANNPQFAASAYRSAPDGDADLDLPDVSAVAVPECDVCGGTVKPDVVFYGASVARSVVDAAYALVAAADAVLVIGSSLMVYSSFRFVRRAHESGLPVAAINLGVTRADAMLQTKLEDDCCAALEACAELV